MLNKCGYSIMFVSSDSFFANFCMKTDKFRSFLLTIIYISKEFSISITLSAFSVFSNISKTLHSFRTLILFLRIIILLLDLLLLGCK